MSALKERHFHHKDHPGCSAVFPWMPECDRWTTPELLRRAQAEVVGMVPFRRESWLSLFLGNPKFYEDRTTHRNKFIAAIENWGPQDLDDRYSIAANLGEAFEWSKDDIDHEAGMQWNHFRQGKALAVLFAYGELK